VTDALEVVVADAGYWHKKQMGSPRGVGGALSAHWRSRRPGPPGRIPCSTSGLVSPKTSK
jgi:hypothetical protein